MSALDQQVIGWKAWYLDRVYSSESHQWKELPREGLQVLFVYFDDGTRVVYHGADIVAQVERSDKNPYGFAQFSTDKLKEFLRDHPEAVCKYGLLLADETYDAIQRQAWGSRWP